jgi:hypothetical protein
MAELAQLEAALVKADAAGDTEGARILAGEVRKMRSAKPAESSLPKVVDYNPGIGLGETALSLGTGAAGAVAGGFAGLGQAATNALGLTDTPAGDRVRQVSGAMTYEPRTAAGKGLTGGISLPFEKLAEGADWAGGKVTDATGSPAVGTAVNTGIQSIPMLLGPLARAVPGESAAAAAARARAAALNVPKDAGVTAAREAGLKVTPSDAGAGPVARVIEGLSGEPKLAKLASKKNAPTVNDMIRRDVGLADDVPLSREALAAIRAEAGQAYEAVKNAGTVATDAKFKADLYETTKSVDQAAKDFPHRSENPFKKVMEGLNRDSFDAASAVEEVKLLRSDADKAFRTGDKALGGAYKKAAQAIDDMLDRHLQKSGDPAMVEAVAKYREARERIAKTYAADKALNDSTGNIDAAVYAKALKDGKKLSGEARKVGELAQQFPRSMQRTERLGSTGPTIFDLLLGGGAGIIGTLLGGAPGAAGLAMAGARPGMRAGLLSGPVQSAMTKPRTYGQPGLRRLQDLLEEAGSEAGTVGVTAGQGR